MNEYRISILPGIISNIINVFMLILGSVLLVLMLTDWTDLVHLSLAERYLLLVIAMAFVTLGLLLFVASVNYGSFKDGRLVLRSNVAKVEVELKDIRSFGSFFATRHRNTLGNRPYVGYIRLHRGFLRIFIITNPGRRDYFEGEQFFDFVRAAWEASYLEGTTKPVTHPKSAPGRGNLNEAAVHSKRASWFFQGLSIVVVLGLVVIGLTLGVDMFLQALKPAIVVLWVVGYSSIFFNYRNDYFLWLNGRGWDYLHETLRDDNIRLLYDLRKSFDPEGGRVDHFVMGSLAPKKAHSYWGAPPQPFRRTPLRLFINTKRPFQQVWTSVPAHLADAIQKFVTSDDNNVCMFPAAEESPVGTRSLRVFYGEEEYLLITRDDVDDLTRLERVIRTRPQPFICIFSTWPDERSRVGRLVIHEHDVGNWATGISKIAVEAYGGHGYIMWTAES